MRWPRVVLTVGVLAVAMSGSSVLGQHTIWVSPDVPTDLGPPVADYLPWEVVRHDHLAPVPYSLEFVLPGSPAIDALEKMDQFDNWLFSVEAPSDLGGALGGAFAEPRDVVRADVANAIFGLFFDGSCTGPPVPAGSSIDALYLDGGDGGDLITSFDVPTDLGGSFAQPSGLVRWTRVAPGSCGWQLLGPVIDFAATLGAYFPVSANVIGADLAGPSEWILTLDIPTDVAPPGITALPGQVIATNGGVVTGAPFDNLLGEGAPAWTVSSLIDALACQANPATIYDPVVRPVGLLIGKAAGTNITLFWPQGSCSSGADDYGVYEGSLATVMTGSYDHVGVACTDSAPLLQETISPAAASSYYLVVPHNGKVEGSYCFDSAGNPRPQPAAAASRCVVNQLVTSCP